MKKLLLIITGIICVLNLQAQVTATGVYKSYKDTYQGIDYLFVFYGIDASTSLKYTGAGTSVNWYRFSDPASSISNQPENFNVENATGYILDVDGVKTTVWVIDYKNYLPVFNSLVPQDKPGEQCKSLTLNLQSSVPLIEYQTPGGVTHTIARKFKLTYNSKSWTSGAWKDVEISAQYTLPDNLIYVDEAPLCDTKFKIEGDQFATDLNLSPVPSVESALYTAVAVEAHIVTTASTRDALNEDERPSATTVKSGSAPLDILFESNANVPVASYYSWEIFKDGSLLYTRNDKDQRYTFDVDGTYKVKLTVNSSYCTYADSVEIVVSVSALQVPVVFTPGDDGYNDEFKVAYRSLKSFKCWIFNRWGRQLYYWNDPQKGWDGTYKGKPVSTGGYLYVIEAVGIDNVNHSTKGVVNLIRPNKK
jgi:gliding motility-associated-like protein